MRPLLIVATILICLVEPVPRAALASNIAFDTAGDSAYNNGWTQGSNGGFGWGGGWNISSGDGSTALIADPNAGGEINSPFGLAGRSWEVSGDPAISRQFGGALQIGQTFAIAVDPAPGAEYAVDVLFGDLYDNLGIVARGPTYQVGEEHSSTGLITTTITNIPVVDGPVRLSFTRTGQTDYQISVAALQGGTAGTISLSYSPGAPDGFGLGTEYAPLFFDNVNVTPEPSALCLANFATFGLLRRRKQSKPGRG